MYVCSVSFLEAMETLRQHFDVECVSVTVCVFVCMLGYDVKE